MFTLKSEIGMDIAHYLVGYAGKCKNIHGHRYRLVVKVSATDLQKEGQLRGMVDDFGNIKDVLKKISDQFDHKLLIEDTAEGRKLAAFFEENEWDFDVVMVPYRTTVEEMSRDMYHKIKQMGVNVTEVELYETPTNSCIYSEMEGV
ncbi:MAG: 6-carboxytetrahydropterin synthase [Defluviitaleaceae bacterium]|nr:6-carboxytetrahydropterin synthase [Defluviitaleaceae bacterium]